MHILDKIGTLIFLKMRKMPPGMKLMKLQPYHMTHGSTFAVVSTSAIKVNIRFYFLL